MEQYNVFQALYMSFYSRRLYRDVALNWGAKTFGYLLLLLTLTWIVYTYQLQQVINHGYNRVSDPLVAQVPVMTIKNGVVSTPENRPYIIKDPETNETLLVVDTSGTYNSFDDIQTDILVTKTKIFSKPKENQQRIDILPSAVNTTIIPERLNSYIKRFIGFLWMPIFMFALMFSYIYRILQAFFYGLIGWLFARMTKVSLSYWQVSRIMMVAITPVIIVCTVLRALNMEVIHHHLFYFALAMGYMIYAINANKPIR